MKIIYHLIYGIWYIISLLPLKIHYVFSDILFFFVFYILNYRRRIVWVNLVTSFPEKPEEELKEIERGFYHWFCDYIVETIKLLTISKSELQKRMIIKGTENINKCILEGQSCAIYSGHYCNWEWMSSLPLWITPKAEFVQIYHPLENKAFDQLFLKLRQRFNGVCTPMSETLRKAINDQKVGKFTVTGYISDQAPHWSNIHHWCNFLNHDTPVLTGAERIIRKFNQAVFYLDMHRTKRGYYEAELKLITNESKTKNEFEITDIYFKLLESTIRNHPEFWLWSHKRWKRTREKFNLRFEVVNGKVITKKAN